MSPPLAVTEDTPADMLAGSMDLDIVLPSGKIVRMSVLRSTPMMDLLVQITTAHRLSPGNHFLQPIGGRGELPYKPSTPIGALDTFTVRIVQKKAGNLKKAPQIPHILPTTFRLQVHLPRNQLFVTRVSPDVSLGDILENICQEKSLDIQKYELRNTGNLGQRLSQQQTLGQLNTQELTLLIKGSNPVRQLSSADIIHVKQSNNRQNTACDSSISSGSFESRSVSPVTMSAPPPQPPQRKKRRPAPKPPVQEAQTRNVLISHSRESSDSSGYHEPSTLSESPTHGVPASSITGRNSQSLSNLTSIPAGRLSSSVSISSLSSNGTSKKKRAPPPPPPTPKSGTTTTTKSSTLPADTRLKPDPSIDIPSPPVELAPSPPTSPEVATAISFGYSSIPEDSSFASLPAYLNTNQSKSTTTSRYDDEETFELRKKTSPPFSYSSTPSNDSSLTGLSSYSKSDKPKPPFSHSTVKDSSFGGLPAYSKSDESKSMAAILKNNEEAFQLRKKTIPLYSHSSTTVKDSSLGGLQPYSKNDESKPKTSSLNNDDETFELRKKTILPFSHFSTTANNSSLGGLPPYSKSEESKPKAASQDDEESFELRKKTTPSSLHSSTTAKDSSIGGLPPYSKSDESKKTASQDDEDSFELRKKPTPRAISPKSRPWTLQFTSNFANSIQRSIDSSFSKSNLRSADSGFSSSMQSSTDSSIDKQSDQKKVSVVRQNAVQLPSPVKTEPPDGPTPKPRSAAFINTMFFGDPKVPKPHPRITVQKTPLPPPVKQRTVQKSEEVVQETTKTTTKEETSKPIVSQKPENLKHSSSVNFPPKIKVMRKMRSFDSLPKDIADYIVEKRNSVDKSARIAAFQNSLNIPRTNIEEDTTDDENFVQEKTKTCLAASNDVREEEKPNAGEDTNRSVTSTVSEDHDSLSLDWQYQLPPPPDPAPGKVSPDATQYDTVSIATDVFAARIEPEKPRLNGIHEELETETKDAHAQVENNQENIRENLDVKEKPVNGFIKRGKLPRSEERVVLMNKTEVMAELTNVLSRNKERSQSFGNLHAMPEEQYLKKSHTLSHSHSVLNPSLSNFKISSYESERRYTSSTEDLVDGFRKPQPPKSKTSVRRSDSMTAKRCTLNAEELQQQFLQFLQQKELANAGIGLEDIGVLPALNGENREKEVEPVKVIVKDIVDLVNEEAEPVSRENPVKVVEESLIVIKDEVVESIEEVRKVESVHPVQVVTINNVVPSNEVKVEEDVQRKTKETNNKQQFSLDETVDRKQQLALEESSKTKKQVSLDEAPKSFVYRPPTVSMGTWGERPKTTVYIKDEDYTTQENLVEKRPFEPKMFISKSPIKTNDKKPVITIKKPSNYELFSALPKRKETVASNVFLEEEKVKKEPTRLPVVCGVELKKEFQSEPDLIRDLDVENNIRNQAAVQQRTSSVYLIPKNAPWGSSVPNSTKITVSNATRPMPVVKGFREQIVNGTEITVEPIQQNSTRFELPMKNPQTQPQPIKSQGIPPPPPIGAITLKPVSSRPMRAKPVEDPRDQLLEQIRNFGGMNTLRKTVQ